MNPKHGLQVLNYRRAKLIDRVRNLSPSVANDLGAMTFEWYRVRNSADAATTEVLIYDEIDWFWGISADELVRAIQDIDTPNIDIRINSPGGSVFDCIAIYNALVKHPANVTVYVDSLAASGASIIAMAGNKCVMMVGSQMMIHDALGIEMGNAADMRAFAEFLDKQSDNIASIYAEKAGGDPADWRAMMVKETWMFANEAVDLGLADEIYKRSDATDAPAEGSPEEEQTETPEEEQQEETEGDGEGDEPEEGEPSEAPGNDSDATAFLSRNHKLSNHGFKYPGRTKAPVPGLANASKDHDDYAGFMNSLIDKMPLPVRRK